MSAINVNEITGRTGAHGPVLTGVSTAANGFQVLAGEFKVNGISTFVGMSTFGGGVDVTSGTLTLPAVPGTNNNVNQSVLFQTSAGVVDGGSGLLYNPAEDALKVNGNVITSQEFRGSGNVVKLAATNYSSTQYIRVSDKIELEGNVGVLTDNPTGNLEVSGNDGLNISNAQRTGVNGAQWRLIPHSGAGSATNLRLYEGASANEVLNITKTGSIGVGTPAPVCNLHIYGSTVSYAKIESGAGAFNPMIEYKNPDKRWQAGLFGDYSDNYIIRDASAAANRLSINGNGYVGIARTNPDRILSIDFHNSATYNPGTVSAAEDGCIKIFNNSTAANSTAGELLFGSGATGTGYASLTGYRPASQQVGLVLRVSAGGNISEAVRILPTGGVGINTDAALNAGLVSVLFNGASSNGLSLKTVLDANGSAFLNFVDSDGVSIGNVSQVTASTTNYATTSDYRVKENVVDLSGAIDRVKQLSPKRFNFIKDPTTTLDGFLAHEAQAVVPESVTGEKDGEAMQGIDQSKLVPLLTAAIKELEARVAALEGS